MQNIVLNFNKYIVLKFNCMAQKKTCNPLWVQVLKIYLIKLKILFFEESF